MPIRTNKRDGLVFEFYTRRKKPVENDSWISFYKGWRGICFQFGPASYFDNRWNIRFSLGWGCLYIHLPVYSKHEQCDPPTYGFYYFERALWFNLGKRVKKISMPHDLDWVRTSCLRKDGTWEHELKGAPNKDFWDKNKWADKLWSESYPYTYVLKSGEVQKRTATVRVEEREWRMKLFRWTKLFAKKRRTISIDFDAEVGERTGSWKGGTVGCGYEMRDGELPEQTLRRMEVERKFT